MLCGSDGYLRTILVVDEPGFRRADGGEYKGIFRQPEYGSHCQGRECQDNVENDSRDDTAEGRGRRGTEGLEDYLDAVSSNEDIQAKGVRYYRFDALDTSRMEARDVEMIEKLKNGESVVSEIYPSEGDWRQCGRSRRFERKYCPKDTESHGYGKRRGSCVCILQLPPVQ